MKLIDNANINPTGRLVYDVYNNGVLEEHFDENNVIVDGFLDVVANLVGNVTPSPITQIGVGIDGSAANHVDSSLKGMASKTIDSASKPAVGFIQFNFSIGTGDFNGVDISEFGLLTTSGVLCARRIRLSPLPKTSAISINGFWVIKI